MSLSSSHILRGRMRIRGRRAEEEDEVVREKGVIGEGKRKREGEMEGGRERRIERVRE